MKTVPSKLPEETKGKRNCRMRNPAAAPQTRQSGTKNRLIGLCGAAVSAAMGSIHANGVSAPGGYLTKTDE